jgi:hypothetical protein
MSSLQVGRVKCHFENFMSLFTPWVVFENLHCQDKVMLALEVISVTCSSECATLVLHFIQVTFLGLLSASEFYSFMHSSSVLDLIKFSKHFMDFHEHKFSMCGSLSMHVQSSRYGACEKYAKMNLDNFMAVLAWLLSGVESHDEKESLSKKFWGEFGRWSWGKVEEISWWEGCV